MIYLDNAATTKPYNEVLTAVNKINENDYFNPSALYYKGAEAKSLIEKSRSDIASVLGANAEEIFFTSGATEADNWALFSGFKNKKGNIVVSAGEHSAVYESALCLKNKGFDVRFAPLNADGTVNATEFDKLIDIETSLVSVIHYSNETGAVNDISALSKTCKFKNKKLIFHSDGVQAFCKSTFEPSFSEVDLYSVSAHKVGGIKGCGALYIKKGVRLAPLIFGGGQEGNMRSGTENTAAAATFGIAAKIYANEYNEDYMRLLKESFIRILKAQNTEFRTVSGEASCAAVVSLSVAGINSEILQRLLASENIFIGLGSACASKLRTNRVLSEMGISQNEIAGNIRISFSPWNTLSEIEYAALLMSEKIRLLRSGQIG